MGDFSPSQSIIQSKLFVKTRNELKRYKYFTSVNKEALSENESISDYIKEIAKNELEGILESDCPAFTVICNSNSDSDVNTLTINSNGIFANISDNKNERIVFE